MDAAEIRELTAALVRADSRLPREERAAGVVIDWLRGQGFRPEVTEVAPGRPNVTVRAAPGPRRELVTLTGHLDTVDVAEGWDSDPFEPVERGGRLHGLGALDMKSGLACALVAFRRLATDPALAPRLGAVGFAATVDEEAFGTGARALLRTPFGQSAFMVLAEPFHGASPEDPVPVVMPGKILYRIEVQGRTSHALNHPERGINAVDDAARIVRALERLPLGRHPVLGPMNYATLKIEGGYREYAVVVPERCEIVVTRLLAPGETRVGALGELQALIDELGLASRVTVEAAPPSYDPFEVSKDHPGMASFRRAFERSRGRAPVLGGLLGITDANIYQAEGGIPTLIFGPAGRGLHERNEYVEIDSLAPTAAIMVDTVAGFWD
ncbi:MAG: M20 family metallopeptidase [Gemmatimonadales bacterium]